MYLAACGLSPEARSPRAEAPRPPATSAKPAPVANAETAESSASANDQFLVVTDQHELVLRTAKHTLRVLARDVANALYDPTLELVWVEGESLGVVDLRVPGAEPIVIVREWPGTSSLSISHPASLVSSNETCDVGDLASLTWNENPKLERVAEQSSELPLESKEWLRAQLERPARISAEDDYNLRTSESRIEVPADIWRCGVSDDECGRVVRFGAHDLELVLAASLLGDCWHPFCLFHDPRENQWSSPLPGDHWRGDAGNKPGPCGDYAFDVSGDTFLNVNRLCGPGNNCQLIDGHVLGWRNPGPIVGAPGDMELFPDSEPGTVPAPASLRE